ncbi:integrase catalytic domain-containing protein [Nephila pilipes]|uniref:Integrase catalytic domain-containing protein n=1 Tax=Nephila pilipes TaxID=299642 RepID=A0A8X6N3B8_NEPPI|nr:integrase catalytic domain-containing protein [Nephila pilipes]
MLLKKAYSTVEYLSIELDDGNIISNILVSKSRVSPLKTLSIPRLGLMGALLSSRISHRIETAFELHISRFYWIDSSIPYFWMKGDSDRYKIFVKNGIQEI